MFFGQGLSLEACHAAQAERRSANTAMAPASAAAAAAFASTVTAVVTKRAFSASTPVFALSPPAKMDSIASLPTGASADGPSPAIIHDDENEQQKVDTIDDVEKMTAAR